MTAGSNLLLVWNPLLQPNTIWQHAVKLDEHGFVWWPKLRSASATDQEAGVRAARLRAIVEAMTPAVGKSDFIVFVTDFQTLHALRVDEVRLPDASGQLELGPTAEYGEHLKGVEAAFRVVDVIQRGWDQFSTLDYLRRHFAFSPYTSGKRAFPIRVAGPDVAEVFQSPRPGPVCPNLVPNNFSEAKLKAAAQVGADLWNLLGDSTRQFYVNAVMNRREAESNADHLDRVVLLNLSLTMEEEWRLLCEERLDAVLGEPWFGKAFNLARNREFDIRKANTLGSMDLVLRALEKARRVGGNVEASLMALTEHRKWRSWMRSFAQWRNETAHPGTMNKAVAEVIWAEFKAPADLLWPLVKARMGEVYASAFDRTAPLTPKQLEETSRQAAQTVDSGGQSTSAESTGVRSPRS